MLMRSLSNVSNSAPADPEPLADQEAIAAQEGTPNFLARLSGHLGHGQEWLNHFQARHWILAFPIAVSRKYSDDKASRLAALLTYYGFISVFPILLLVVAILQLALKNNPKLMQDIINAIVVPELRGTVERALHNLPPAGIPLLIGAVSLLLAGMGGAYAAYATVTQVLHVPYRRWFGFAPRYLRVIATLLLVIFGVIAMGAIITLSSKTHVPILKTPAWSFIISVGFLWLLLYLSIKLLSPRPTTLHEVWLGCTLAAIALQTLIYLGGWLLSLLVAQKSAVYGTFASFIGLLALVFLMAQALVISAEISTVWAWRLWPRSTDVLVYFDADVRAMRLLANMEARLPRERLSVTFVDDPKDDPDPFLEAERSRGTGAYGRDPWGIRGEGGALESQDHDQDGES